MGLGFEFECDTETGANCSNKTGRMFRLGLKGSFEGKKGAYGQPTNLGPGWNNQGEYVENRIGTNRDYDLSANIGGYLRTDLDKLFDPYGSPHSLGNKLRDRNWNPVHLNLGYNRHIKDFMTGEGSNNLTAKLAHSGDQFTGSAGHSGFFGNRGGSSRPGFSYGLQGNYNLDQKRLDNIGAFGRIGMMGPLGIHGYAGINPQTWQPNFGGGMSIKFDKGGAVPSYDNGDDVNLGLGGSELSYGTSGLTTKINPTLNMGRLNLGGEFGGLHSFNDDVSSKYFLGGTGRFNFDSSGRRVRDWDPRFMGSLSGNVGYGRTGSEKQGNLSNQGLAASGRLDLGVGRPGKTFCVGNACDAPPVIPWDIGAFGEYGNQYSLNPGLRTGVKGQYNWLSGEGGYDLTNKSPFFKAGLNIPLSR